MNVQVGSIDLLDDDIISVISDFSSVNDILPYLNSDLSTESTYYSEYEEEECEEYSIPEMQNKKISKKENQTPQIAHNQNKMESPNIDIIKPTMPKIPSESYNEVLVKNFMIPNCDRFTTATFCALRGNDFPETRSGLRSTYIRFQLHPSLPVITSPVCYNKAGEAVYMGGYNIDLKGIDASECTPVLSVYDIISESNHEFIGCCMPQLQDAKEYSNALVIAYEKWFDIIRPKSRIKSGKVQISLIFHDGSIPPIKNQPVKNKFVVRNPNFENSEISENEQEDKGMSDSQVPILQTKSEIKEDVEKPIKSQENKKPEVIEVREVQQKPSINNFNKIDKKDEQTSHETKNIFDVDDFDDYQFADSITINISKHCSWKSFSRDTPTYYSANMFEKPNRPVLKFATEVDLDKDFMLSPEDINPDENTRSSNNISPPRFGTSIISNQKDIFSEKDVVQNNDFENESIPSKAEPESEHNYAETNKIQNNDSLSNENLLGPNEKVISVDTGTDKPVHVLRENPIDTKQKSNIQKETKQFVMYSDYGFFSRKRTHV